MRQVDGQVSNGDRYYQSYSIEKEMEDYDLIMLWEAVMGLEPALFWLQVLNFFIGQIFFFNLKVRLLVSNWKEVNFMFLSEELACLSTQYIEGFMLSDF